MLVVMDWVFGVKESFGFVPDRVLFSLIETGGSFAECGWPGIYVVEFFKDKFRQCSEVLRVFLLAFCGGIWIRAHLYAW